ncbi:hypothetical protein [Hanstruepera ponticola]|uniref:hypothetical protein n=1 Tax=Hanstruepera ponticola TaxID=2042995 RepID=UPI00177DFC14|nr:hypothetical protein [Hanstruepera ponticola]
MNKYVFIGFFFISSLMSSQSINLDTDVPWTIGVGVNIVDNDGFRFDDPFDADNWNFKNPLSINVERKWRDFFSTNLAITLNKLTKDNKQNNGYLTESSNLFAIDLTGRFIFDQYIWEQNPRIDPFEGYVLAGFGYTSVLSKDSMMFDVGLGFNFWLYEDIGIRLQTMGKFGFNDYQYLKNYIQHTAEFIIRF